MTSVSRSLCAHQIIACQSVEPTPTLSQEQKNDKLIGAILELNLGKVKALLLQGADRNSQSSQCHHRGMTPLCVAIKYRHLDGKEIIKFLIESKVDLDIQDNDGKTALHIACDKRCIETTKLLIESGARWDVEDNQGKTPLSLAIDYVMVDVVKLMIEKGVDPNVRFKDGMGLLSYIIKQKHCYRINVNGFGDTRSFPPGSLELERLVVERMPDVNAKDGQGKTPLESVINHSMLNYSCCEIAKLLLARGADIDTNGKEALSYLQSLMSIRDIEGVRSLLSRGMNLKGRGAYPLSLAINVRGKSQAYRDEYDDGEDPDPKRVLVGTLEFVRLIIEAGADLDIEDYRGKTQLIRAMLNGDIELARLLFEGGADMNRKGKYWRDSSDSYWDRGSSSEGSTESSLSMAIMGGHTELAILMLEKHAVSGSENIWHVETGTVHNERTYLQKTIKDGNIKLTDYLIKKGAYLIKGKTLKTDLYEHLLLQKLVRCRDPQIRELILDVILSTDHEDGQNAFALKIMNMAIEKDELKVLRQRLLERNHEDLNSLKRDFQDLKSQIKKADDETNKKELQEQLAAKKAEITAIKKTIKEALVLYRAGDIDEAKKLLNVKEHLHHRAIVSAYLIGILAQSSSIEIIEPVIDAIVNNRDLKDVNSHRVLLSTITTLLKAKNDDKSTVEFLVFRKIMGGLDKEIRVLSMLQMLIKLEGRTCFQGIIDSTEPPLECLKSAVDRLFQSKFNLAGVENAGEKYERTFKNFRNPEGIFIYLSSLIQHQTKGKVFKNLLSMYVRDVLEGRFVEERYNLDHSAHLKKIFSTRPELLEEWKKNETLSPGKLCQVVAKEGDSEFKYTEFFREKIITDSHLGDRVYEDYPYLFKGLENPGNIQEYLEELDREPPHEGNKGEILEFQKLMLTLCQDKNLDREAQIEKLKKILDLKSFKTRGKGTEFENDLRVILKRVEFSAEFKWGEEYTVCCTDDPCDLLLAGSEMQGSCQRLGGSSSLNSGLLGPLLDAKYRVVAVKKSDGQMVARCFLKILLDKKTGEPVLFQERLYINHNRKQNEKLLDEMCKRKAKAIGLPLLKLSDKGQKEYPNAVVSLGGRSSVEYVDALRGIQGNTYEIPNAEVIPLD